MTRIAVGRQATARGPAYYVQDNGVGFGGEADKPFSSLLRKFGSRFTITSAGAGGSLGGATSIRRGAGGGDEQAAASPQSSQISVRCTVVLLESVLVGTGNAGQTRRGKLLGGPRTVLGSLHLGRRVGVDLRFALEPRRLARVLAGLVDPLGDQGEDGRQRD